MGDWLVATGQAKVLHAQRGLPVLVLGRDGRPQWSDVFEHNPKIVRSPLGRDVARLTNGPHARPYIDHYHSTKERWVWKPFGPTPGEIFLTAAELAHGDGHRGAVMIEPAVKKNAHSNKAWLWDRWQAVVDANPNIHFVQCGPLGSRWLQRVTPVVTQTFRQACAVLYRAGAFVGTEGGLMHAAAALSRPALVLWSEFIAPEITGYTSQINIRHADKACGKRAPCPTCLQSMQAITVDEVNDKLRGMLA